jgi:hypothetical protein
MAAHKHDYKYSGPHGETETDRGRTWNTMYARWLCQNLESFCPKPVLDKLIRRTEVKTK